MGDGPAAGACGEDATSDLDVKPETYYLGTRDEMLGFIPEGVDTILEVGCAAGGFGHQLKLRGVREVWGVEMFEAAARQAESVLDKVLVGDIANLIDQLPETYFDVIVFNDVRKESRPCEPGQFCVSGRPSLR